MGESGLNRSRSKQGLASLLLPFRDKRISAAEQTAFSSDIETACKPVDGDLECVEPVIEVFDIVERSFYYPTVSFVEPFGGAIFGQGGPGLGRILPCQRSARDLLKEQGQRKGRRSRYAALFSSLADRPCHIIG